MEMMIMSDFRDDFKQTIDAFARPKDEQKKDMWRYIDAGIKEHEMKKKRNKAALMAASLLLVALAVFAVATPVGHAAVSKILGMFVPEKQVEITMEGQEETSDQGLYIDGKEENEQVVLEADPEQTPKATQAQVVRYALYVDETRYVVEKQGEVDVITPKDYPADYPPVAMRISQEPNMSVDDMVTRLHTELKANYDNVNEIEDAAFAHVSGKSVYAFNGDINGDKDTMPQWDDAVLKVYVLDNTVGGVFVVEMRYFIEAEEGHGARMEAMMDGFEVIVD